jgi:hypothetical protein
MEMEPSATDRMLNPVEWRVVPRNAYVNVDNTNLFTEFDIETPIAWTEKINAEGEQLLVEGNQWLARNGDMYYRATPGDNRPFMEFAMRYFARQDQRAASWNVALAPNSKPIISAVVDPAQTYEVEPLANAAFSYRFSVSPHSVEIYLAVQPEIQMRAIPKFEQRV